MRRKQRHTSEESALSLLDRVSFVHLASLRADGTPVLRALSHVRLGQKIVFHGALAGETNGLLGRAGVVSADLSYSVIPSTMVDPIKACPATVYYQSAQAKGRITELLSTEEKAQALTALMEKLQKEGGYRPLCPHEPICQTDYRTTRVFCLEIEELTGKMSLGQERPKDWVHRIVLGLWQRGEELDLTTIRAMLGHSPHDPPDLFLGPAGVRFEVLPSSMELSQVSSLLRDRYWRKDISASEIESAFSGSSARVLGFDAEGQVVACARAVSDGELFASVHDVVVRDDYQGHGVGRALMALLLDHPRLRNVKRIQLGTADKMSFYGHFGFRPAAELALSFPSHAMVKGASPL